MAAVAALVAGLLAPAGPARAADPCAPPVVNKVACENTRPGTPDTEWRVTPDDAITGYTTDISTNLGGRVEFKVDTESTSWRIEIYRLGWYGGAGARRVDSIGNFGRQHQPPCATTVATGLVDCGGWSVSASWTVPTTLVSGLYYAVLHRNDGDQGENAVPFVVRDDASRSDILFQTSDSSWQAYNRYGGNSLYYGTAPGPQGSAFAVSYNRPIDGSGGAENFIFNAEVPALRFLERNGYDVSYFTDLDADRRGGLITNHRVYLPVGHDEYWSANQVANVTAARAAGVNLAFLTANEIFWKVRYDGRTIVCWKETKADAKTDPDPTSWTGTWRDRRAFVAGTDGGRPENALLGQMFGVNGHRADALQVPATYGRMRLWRNTPLATLADGDMYAFATGTLGYEWDTVQPNADQPPGVAQLSRTTVSMTGDYILKNEGYVYGPGTATHALTYYRDRDSGARVFATGTVQWAWGLDAYHDYHDYEDNGAPWPTVDRSIQQATVNILADLGVRPATLMAGLTATSASTDGTPPTVTVDPPEPGSVVAGNPAAFTGTVADAAGQVAGVEVSVDGGRSWAPADWVAGSDVWRYRYTPARSGDVDVRVRAVDDSANLSGPAGRTVTAGPRECPCSIWSGADVPATMDAGDAGPYEVGLRFRSERDGYLRGVRFFKSADNTGGHTGTLWSNTGTRLAIGTFTDETAAGWQTLAFARPVRVTANTTYVASYHTNTGHFAGDPGYFATAAHQAEPLTALQDGIDGRTGVFRPGASGFPTQTFGGGNYWVDVLFATDPGPDTSPPSVAERSPEADTFGARPDRPVTVTFDEPVRSAGLEFTVDDGTTSVPGTVELGADRTTVTFTPTADLAGGTAFTAAVRATDDLGNEMTAADQWTFTTGKPRPVTCPCTIWDDFTAPATANVDDPGAIELGTKVRFDTAGYVTGVRFYKGPKNTGTHTGSLWDAAGNRLATGTFTDETGSGWQQLTFDAPVRVARGTTYLVSYHTDVGYYAATGNYFNGTGAGYRSLHALANGTDGGNGVFRYGATGFPNLTYGAANYWVDVVFTNSLSGDGTAPAVTATSPPAVGTGVPADTAFTATFDEPIDPDSLAFELRDAGGAPISGSTGYAATTRTATFTPASRLSAGATYTASVTAADPDANAMAEPVSWSATVLPTQTCPCTLFPDAGRPTVSSAADTGAYELGLRFTASRAVSVTGVRFHKGVDNAGTHTGSLWDAAGTQLATGTFTGETESGWQTLTFADPVPLVAGATYVASYTAPAGRYAADVGYFGARPAVSVPLTGTTGVYGSPGLFPEQTYQSSNYWVDVIAR